MINLEGIFEQALRDAKSERNDQGRAIQQDADRAVPILRDALAVWDKPNAFKRGDILKVAKHSSFWKDTLGIVIVREVHERVETVAGEFGSAVASFDMRILVIGDDGSVLEHRAHSRDFDLVGAAR